MLTPSQITALFDYVKLFRFQAEKLTREAASNSRLDPELRDEIIREQKRRARELTRLEKALGDEIEAINEEVKPGCKRETESPQAPDTVPRAKRKSSATGKKSKGPGAGTTGTNSSGKIANDSSGKRKRGRPRKHPLKDPTPKRKPGRPRKTAATE